MAWIKRNLFFVVGGLIALALLGGAGFYIYKGWDRNSTAKTALSEVVGNLKSSLDQKPSPGNEKVDNIQIARDQNKQLKDWTATASERFAVIDTIPSGTVTSEAFAGALRRTIDQLQKEAEAAGVLLPPKYDFSFAAQRPLVKFAGSLDPIAAQLGEVKTIAEVLFAARVNALDGIQRVRMSDDDAAGSQSDYIDARPVTNDLAVIVPYVITFRSFTPELAHVIEGFAKAPSTFIVKSVNVQPAGSAGMLTAGNADMPAGAPPMMRPGMEGYGGYPSQQPAAATMNRGGLQTVLKEQLLRITMEVDLVKLAPKKN